MKKTGFNKFEIRDDYAVFFIINRKGMKFEVKIDIEDLKRLIDYGYSWQSWYNKNNDSYYIRRSESYKKENGKYSSRRIALHRWILNAPEGTDVDHINYDTMDYRKANLRAIAEHNNSSNRKGANKNSGTGHRNVNYGRNKAEYWVQFCRKSEYFKWIFPLTQFEEACNFADRKRKEIFGEFAGNG